MNPEIKRYLDEHGATYTRDALRSSLIQAGHDPAAVDAALGEWEAARAGAGPDLEKRITFGRWAIGLHVAALVAVFVLLVVLKGTSAIGLALLGCAILGVALVIGWVISSMIGRALLPGAGVVVALIVPAISALLLGGTCFALLNAAVGTPPRQGTVQLHILAPRAFDGSGSASCFGDPAIPGVEVNSQVLGTLDSKDVTVSVSWYGNDPNNPAPATRAEVRIFLEGIGEGQVAESFGVIVSTVLDVDAASDDLSGTITFEGLASEPTGEPGQPTTPEFISGSVSWNCE
jgi:hypothetical protein